MRPVATKYTVAGRAVRKKRTVKTEIDNSSRATTPRNRGAGQTQVFWNRKVIAGRRTARSHICPIVHIPSSGWQKKRARNE
jgi:hypothetical protein